VYAAVAAYVSELPPPTPPLTVGAPALATTGGVPQLTTAQVGAGPVNVPLAWQVAVALPTSV
jgi:hypothetical protein